MLSPRALTAGEKAELAQAEEKLGEAIEHLFEAFETICEREPEEGAEAYGALWRPLEGVRSELKRAVA